MIKGVFCGQLLNIYLQFSLLSYLFNYYCLLIYINICLSYFWITFTLGYGTLREEKTPQIHISHSHQLGSNPSIYSGGIGHGSQHSTGSLDQVTSPTGHSAKPANTGEDLYSWMAKQQEFIKDNDKGNLKGNWVSYFSYYIRYIYIFLDIKIQSLLENIKIQEH